MDASLLLLLLLLRSGEASSSDVKREDCARAREGGEGVDVGGGVGGEEEEEEGEAFAWAVEAALDVAVLPGPAFLLLSPPLVGVPGVLLPLRAEVLVAESVVVGAGAEEMLVSCVGVPTGADAEPVRDPEPEAEGKRAEAEGELVPVDETLGLRLAEGQAESLALGLAEAGGVARLVPLPEALRVPRRAAAVAVPAPFTAVLLAVAEVEALLLAELQEEMLGERCAVRDTDTLGLSRGVELGSVDADAEGLTLPLPVALPAAALKEGNVEGHGEFETLPETEALGLSRLEALALRERRGETEEVGEIAPGVRDTAGLSEAESEGVCVGVACGMVGDAEGVEAPAPPARVKGVPVAPGVKTEVRVARVPEAVGAALVAEGEAVIGWEGVGRSVPRGLGVGALPVAVGKSVPRGLGVGALPVAVPSDGEAVAGKVVLGLDEAVIPRGEGETVLVAVGPAGVAVPTKRMVGVPHAFVPVAEKRAEGVLLLHALGVSAPQDADAAIVAEAVPVAASPVALPSVEAETLPLKVIITVAVLVTLPTLLPVACKEESGVRVAFAAVPVGAGAEVEGEGLPCEERLGDPVTEGEGVTLRLEEGLRDTPGDSVIKEGEGVGEIVEGADGGGEADAPGDAVPPPVAVPVELPVSLAVAVVLSVGGKSDAVAHALTEEEGDSVAGAGVALETASVKLAAALALTADAVTADDGVMEMEEETVGEEEVETLIPGDALTEGLWDAEGDLLGERVTRGVSEAVPLPPLCCVPLMRAVREGVEVALAHASAVAVPAPPAEALLEGVTLPLAPPPGLGVAALPVDNGESVGDAVPLSERVARAVVLGLPLALGVPRAVRLAREALAQALTEALGVPLPLPVGSLLREALEDAAEEELEEALKLAPPATLPLGVPESAVLPLAAAGVPLGEIEARLVPDPPPASAAVLEAVLRALEVAPPGTRETLAGALAVGESVATLGVAVAVSPRDAEEDCVEVLQRVGPPVAVTAPLAVPPPSALKVTVGVGVLPGAEGEGVAVNEAMAAEAVAGGVALEQRDDRVEGEVEAQGVGEGVSLALPEKEEEGEGEREKRGELLPSAREALAALLAVGKRKEALGLREEQDVGEGVVQGEGVVEAVMEAQPEPVAREVPEFPWGGLAVVDSELQPVPLAVCELLLHALAWPLALAPA